MCCEISDRVSGVSFERWRCKKVFFLEFGSVFRHQFVLRNYLSSKTAYIKVTGTRMVLKETSFIKFRSKIHDELLTFTTLVSNLYSKAMRVCYRFCNHSSSWLHLCSKWYLLAKKKRLLILSHFLNQIDSYFDSRYIWKGNAWNLWCVAQTALGVWEMGLYSVSVSIFLYESALPAFPYSNEIPKILSNLRIISLWIKLLNVLCKVTNSQTMFNSIW